MGDLVLRTRVSVLKRNLKEVTLALTAVGASQSDLRELCETVALARAAIRDSNNGVFNALEALKYVNQPDENVTHSKSSLQQVFDDRDSILDHLALIESKAEAVLNRVPNLSEGGVAQSVNELLTDGTQDALAEVATLERDLAGPADSAGLQQAWEGYRATLQNTGEKVFAEYVDLLGGLALRGTGLDRGISQMADQLIRRRGPFRQFLWNSLTIPAQREALEETVAQIVRLGFPEWTVWALPLAAHEFGHVLVRRDEKLKAIAERVGNGSRPRSVEILLADSFATFVMGPAYACAALLMRFDPWSAREDDRLTLKRASTILDSLGRLTVADDPLKPIRERLAGEWDTALQQTIGAESLADELDDGDRQVLEQMSEEVYDLMPQHIFEPERWPRIEELADVLAAGVEKVTAEPIKVEDELRDVLNAAWEARLSTPRSDEIDEIAVAAEQLWRRIEREIPQKGVAQPGVVAALGTQAPAQRLRLAAERGRG